MIIRLVNHAFKIKRLKEENKKLRSELEQKNQTIHYLNGCVNKANKRYLQMCRQVNFLQNCDSLSFPNSETDKKISIYDILEN